MNVPRFLRRLFRAPFDGLRHFGVVEPGVLYRCGQPRPDELSDLIQKYGLRTVVSLRGSRDETDPDSWEAGERAVCDAAGVEFITIPCNHKSPPTIEQARRFLAICDAQDRRPVLVHCRLGQQRTLLFCAIYRHARSGQSAPDAVREMDELGFDIRHRRHQRLLASFYDISAALASKPATR
ncbi:MAG: tyrosine-protein phosphatase [Phycisphaerae bacterium]